MKRVLLLSLLLLAPACDSPVMPDAEEFVGDWTMSKWGSANIVIRIPTPPRPGTSTCPGGPLVLRIAPD